MAKKYATAAAFKTALEARLRRASAERGVPLGTLQLKFAIERLLARLFRDPSPPWLLKGGFAMDLRFRPHARTTKDVDLSIIVPAGADGPSTAALRERLQAAADIDAGDHLSYRIGEPRRELTNAPRGGARYPCEVVLIGKVYARFQIDVGIGDAAFGEPEELLGDDLLDFAGVAPARALAIPKAQQFAEKAHAYTFPWSGRLNTRTKDLVDLVVLIERGPPEPGAVRSALGATFAARATHPLPAALPEPPAAWAADFPAMAEEAGISTMDYLEAYAIVGRFWASLSASDLVGEARASSPEGDVEV
jgi:hypothetical protein